ncbi:MAG TPA: hypothetical protein VHG28_12220 [Longimicrobiaceae bacterium]|nr:hypothetical protein [Longimicrobiaceae bacterium]
MPIGVRDAEVDGTAAQVLEIDMAAVDLTRVRFEATQNSLLEAAIAVTVVEFLQSRPASALLCTAPRRGC